MTVKDKIIQELQGMPESLQAEVLKFVERLEAKTKKDESDWASLSLTSALRGMENDPASYSLADLKERFA